jgi:hypothetical protein
MMGQLIHKSFIVLALWTGISIPLLLMFSGCSMLLLEDDLSGLTVARTESLLLLVDDGMYGDIEASIGQYRSDLEDEGYGSVLHRWEGGTAADVKLLLKQFVISHGIGGAFFIGALPSAWYELEGLTGHEEFPCDIFYMDLDASWQDHDGDGMWDSHSPLDLEIFVSRIAGAPQSMGFYFDKIHAYKGGSLSVQESAFIFKDNAWSDYNRGSTHGLDNIYGTIRIWEDVARTSVPSYLAQLTADGAEFVYQWIHSYPPLLCFEHEDRFQYLSTTDISVHNINGLFYNLFNCSASRYTENNLAAAYLLQTDYGLATTGSTKPGGNYYPKAFHYLLGQDSSWGEAFKGWYNNYGVTDDRWFLGMVLLGDPMLKPTKTVQKVLKTAPLTEIPPDTEEIERLHEELVRFTDRYGVNYGDDEGTFDEYRADNPQFFLE